MRSHEWFLTSLTLDNIVFHISNLNQNLPTICKKGATGKRGATDEDELDDVAKVLGNTSSLKLCFPNKYKLSVHNGFFFPSETRH